MVIVEKNAEEKLQHNIKKEAAKYEHYHKQGW